MEFVDTNILVYAHDRTAADKAEAASALIGRLWIEGTGAISVQVLQEFFVTVTTKVARPLEPSSAIEAMADYARWRVHSPTAGDVLAAAEAQRRNRTSFWDAMIVRSAHQLGCSLLWSEDLAHGRRYDGVLVKNPLRGGE